MKKLIDYKDDTLYFHYALDDKPDPNEFTMHNHRFYEIYFFISGKGVFYIEGSEYPLHSGDLLIMNSNEAHYIAIDSSAAYERFAIHFNKELIYNVDPSGTLVKAFENRGAGKNNLFVRSDFKDDTYSVLLNNIINSDASHRRMQAITNLFALLNEICVAYDTTEKSRSSGDETVIYSIIRYINGHIKQPLSLDEICDRFFISKAQLCRVFKKTTGATVWDYITVKRLSAAQDMILSGQPVTRVFTECGFGDYSAFYRAYKRHFGCSPTETSDNYPV